MKKNDRIEKIKKYVRDTMVCPGHNIEHVLRVYNICLALSKEEKIDHEVLEAATLLHDIGGDKEMADKTGKTDHAIESSRMAEPILQKLGFSQDKIKHIQDCIISHRYKTDNKPKTLEAKLLFDADKLDALGAIGVARLFAWIGKNNAHIYKKVDSIDEYLRDNFSKMVNGRIKAKKIAKERLNFFKFFLDRLEEEVEGKL